MMSDVVALATCSAGVEKHEDEQDESGQPGDEDDAPGSAAQDDLSATGFVSRQLYRRLRFIAVAAVAMLFHRSDLRRLKG